MKRKVNPGKWFFNHFRTTPIADLLLHGGTPVQNHKNIRDSALPPEAHLRVPGIECPPAHANSRAETQNGALPM